MGITMEKVMQRPGLSLMKTLNGADPESPRRRKKRRHAYCKAIYRNMKAMAGRKICPVLPKKLDAVYSSIFLLILKNMMPPFLR
jgi:hypothetical protein